MKLILRLIGLKMSILRVDAAIINPKTVKPNLYPISPDVAGEIYLPGYNVEISDLSIYGYGTKTVVIRAM